MQEKRVSFASLGGNTSSGRSAMRNSDNPGTSKVWSSSSTLLLPS
ncbi:hypothetical protein OIU79_014578 [Salix purpurea]|uniref:Uncharacterized protein n=1 Tax=Salix purpurea TaxID=77065 RepID=A0A9Q0SWP9_SALPP|nr:hypothetical protein OIU79_014578 [Salix purpurea]